MSVIPANLHRLVVQRAGDRCEYCGLSQEGQEARFHIDHVVPVVCGGPTVEENLALACVSCSLRKAARQRAFDPLTDAEAALFNPRVDSWEKHFRWDGVQIEGLTPAGRATATALKMNRALILSIRAEETLRGRHPPPVAKRSGIKNGNILAEWRSNVEKRDFFISEPPGLSRRFDRLPFPSEAPG
ncbi:MAG: HNH endonuclease [Pirellulales bacterium]|nr:HNH endonuclease [Pirellulales bacterium]